MKLVWLLVPLAIQLPAQCESIMKKKNASTRDPVVVMKCTEEGQKCRKATGGTSVCIVGDAQKCENPPCLICD